MTTAQANLAQAVAGLSKQQAEKLIAGLNQALANLTDLALDYKQAHWNVVGTTFYQLHEMFDEFASQAREWGDLVAERAVQLGGAAHGTLEAAAAATQLPPYPQDEHDGQALLRHLVECARVADEQIRKEIEASDADLATQDIYLEIARGLEKQRWMLQAHLR
ncbi:MAG: DNA starvation/stationary phase protection protein Dps [Chloroflexi bacterium]|jgi:starvation-inducible DNA-binding protein|nr:DNA starvation/stationary phase protection protein Dps [Chloroflexota bacterium]GIW09652.1 MAG: DNA starvation/stationary phase protection protein [Dehalococcoidia bacterium]